MDYGLCLPNFPAGASPEGLAAGAGTAAALGWSTIWTTDHVLVDHASADDYGRIFEAIVTLAWLGGTHPSLRLGTSVIVVPQRNAVILAKELASLDALSGGRVIAGVGVGWSREEFANLGMEDRFRRRGVYLSETIRLWRHLWSGTSEPFEGRLHRLEDFVFEPLPAQGANLPIVIGGRSEAALRRAGLLADGYHSSAASPEQFAGRVPLVLDAARGAGRPDPAFSARVWVQFDSHAEDHYALRGSPEAMAAEIRKFADLGVSHLALWFETTDPDALVSAMERFHREVEPLV